MALNIKHTEKQRILKFQQYLRQNNVYERWPSEQETFWEVHQWLMACKDGLKKESDLERVRDLGRKATWVALELLREAGELYDRERVIRSARERVAERCSI